MGLVYLQLEIHERNVVYKIETGHLLLLEKGLNKNLSLSVKHRGMSGLNL